MLYSNIQLVMYTEEPMAATAIVSSYLAILSLNVLLVMVTVASHRANTATECALLLANTQLVMLIEDTPSRYMTPV